MDYYLLTDMAAQIGYELAAAGAETFRIEETMRRVLAAYGIECEAFAIPNCVMVSLEADNGKPLMVMKRVGFHGNDLDAVEQLKTVLNRFIEALAVMLVTSCLIPILVLLFFAWLVKLMLGIELPPLRVKLGDGKAHSASGAPRI